MKKILGLTIAALMVMGLIGGGTWAYFSDPESTTNNVLAAGTLDLTINGADTAVNMLSLDTKAPGDSGNASVTLANAGNITGELDIDFSYIINTESTGITEYEADSLNGTGAGELGGVAELAIFLDLEPNDLYDGSDIGLKYDGTYYTYPTAMNWAQANSYNGTAWNDAVASFTGSDKFWINWRIPFGGSADNTFQGDSMSANITFSLEQDVD
ncbi:TasA family protein [Chloroflexota bacterium]